MSNTDSRSRGAIYTPSEFADFLASWAIRASTDIILDTGVGDGVFVLAAYYRLLQLKASPQVAQSQVFGAEIDSDSYKRFLSAAQQLDAEFPNVRNVDFFDLKLPALSVVIGNPPYVRRSQIANVDYVRQSVMNANPDIAEERLSRLSDLYVYFLLRAASALGPGGRLAVIVADPWMNTEYGVALKDYLQDHFDIEDLISLDRRVFNDAQVKPVLLRATKKGETGKTGTVKFVRVKNGLPIETVGEILKQPKIDHRDIAVFTLQSAELDARAPWNTYFLAHELYDELASHRLMVPLANLAETRLGVQTLAKEFFVLTQDDAKAAGIEKGYLEPLAQSAKYLSGPIIAGKTEPTHFLFYCAQPKRELDGTSALAYILRGENAIVPVRGKQETVVGYHNKRRIQEDGRPNWYDLRTRVESRGRAKILIPRLVYRTLQVTWNQAGYVPGELFIEVLPYDRTEQAAKLMLAVLSSSVMELCLRVHAQVYGGGTFNISPGQIKQAPILDLQNLDAQAKVELVSAYDSYVASGDRNRSELDQAIFTILCVSPKMQKRTQNVLEEMISVATALKHREIT